MQATSQASRHAQTHGARAKAKPKRYGCEKPRVYTPPLQPLEPRSPITEKRTLGYDVIDFAEDVLHVNLFPWQKWLLVHMLELLDDSTLRFRTVVVLIARQNGKSTLSQVLALWFMVVWGWPLVMGTAQDLETAEEVWQGAVDLVEEDDELSTLLKRVVKVNGKKALELTNNTRYKVKAANRKAGRGFTGNLIMLDELREHQNWDAWGAITKTTMAQLEALVLALSNAGDMTSVVLRYLRQMAHAAIGDPDGINKDLTVAGPTELDLESINDFDEDLDDLDELDDLEQDEETLALFEWSATPGCSKWDRDQWAQANPSLNWNPAFTERTIASACKTDPEWVFRTEVLCQWAEGTLDGPFPPGSWDAGKNIPITHEDGTQSAAEEDKIVGQVMAGLAQSYDRDHVVISFAGHRADGIAQVEVVVVRRKSDWVKGWLMDPKRRDRIQSIAGQTKGAPISPLMAELIEAFNDPEDSFDIPIVDWQGSDLTAGWAGVIDAVRDRTVKHHPQPILDIAAATAAVKVFGGGASIPDYKASPADIASLMSFTAAHWLLGQKVEEPPPPPPPPAAVESTHAVTDMNHVAHMGF